MAEPVPVRARDCACPGSPHPEGDIVYIRPTLSLDGGLAATEALREISEREIRTPADATDAQKQEIGLERINRALQGKWLRVFLEHGAVGWNLDEPFSVEALLEDYSLARPVADEAADRYTMAVLAPFMKPSAPTSPLGLTADSTSPSPASSRSPRKRQ